MAIEQEYIENFGTLTIAMSRRDAKLVRCFDKKTNKDVIVIAAIFPDEDGKLTLTPLAKMFDGNPYEELDPPVTFEAVELDDEFYNDLPIP